MTKNLHFLIIDDDKVVLEEYSRILKRGGYTVTTLDSSQHAFEKIHELNPDCVLCDLLLPGIDGLDLFQQIKNDPNANHPIFIIITGKQYEYDQRRAIELGVDGYIIKPIQRETFIDEILGIINNKIIIEFWGCRGTLTAPGPETLKYGGNTNCVTLNIANKQSFIFDAGTGIKSLSNYLMSHNKLPLNAKIFLTHPHYDHICGIPFFMPLYEKGNQFELLGPNQHGCSIDKVIANLMDSIYFPVTIKEFSAKLTFRALTEETFYIDDIKIQTIYLNHPGRCLGYRVVVKDKIFCYITDNELYLKDSLYFNHYEVERLLLFINNANVLVIDATYNDDEYNNKVGWGHSCVSRVVDIADKANVKLLCLYHHDPDQNDADIDKKLEHAITLLNERHSKTKCIAPHEGDRLVI